MPPVSATITPAVALWVRLSFALSDGDFRRAVEAADALRDQHGIRVAIDPRHPTRRPRPPRRRKAGRE